MGVRASGTDWSGLGGSGSRVRVGSSNGAGAEPGTPGMVGASTFDAALAALRAARPIVFFAVALPVLAGFWVLAFFAAFFAVFFAVFAACF